MKISLSHDNSCTVLGMFLLSSVFSYLKVHLHEIFSAYCIVNTGVNHLPVNRYMDLMRDLCKRYLNMMEDSQENEVMIVFMMTRVDFH